MDTITIDVQGVPELVAELQKLEKTVTNLRPLWPAHRELRLRSQRAYMDSEGRSVGQEFTPLTPDYQRRKLADGYDKPILQRDGGLYESVTQANAPGSIYDETDVSLTMGTENPLAILHHEGRDALPERLVINVGEEELNQHERLLVTGMTRLVAQQTDFDGR